MIGTLWALGAALACAQAPGDASLDRFFDRRVERPASEVSAEGREPLARPSASKPPSQIEILPIQHPIPADGDWDGLAEAMKSPEDGPRALELLSRAILEGRGGPAARSALHRGLDHLAKLKDEEKAAFVEKLGDPAAIFIPIAVSQAPHSYEAHVMADRMSHILKATGSTVSRWVDENGANRFAGLFYLRLDAYDRLHTYLNQHPAEARPVAGAAFDGVGSVRGRAHALQALTERMTGGQTTLNVRREFARGSMEALDELPPPRAKALASLLWLYRERWADLRDEVEAKAVETLGERPKDVPAKAPPYDGWPGDRLTATFHFADADRFDKSLRFFRSKGYDVILDGDGVTLVKSVGERSVRLRWTSYVADEEGFLVDGELDRFEQAVKRDLADPAVQLVVVRAHNEVSKVRMLQNGASDGKVFFDGTCRGVWTLSSASAQCPSCSFVVNVGGGDGDVNDKASHELIEGLARGEGWDEIAERIKKAMPSGHRRLIGPWAPPFADSLSAK